MYVPWAVSYTHLAKAGKRIQETLKYALQAVAFFSLFWTVIVLAVPNLFIYIFMSPTANVLAIAPGILRSYGISFLLLPLNIFSTYYFQSIMKAGASFFVSVMRGVVISGIMIYILPQMCIRDSRRPLYFILQVFKCLHKAAGRGERKILIRRFASGRRSDLRYLLLPFQQKRPCMAGGRPLDTAALAGAHFYKTMGKAAG